MVLVGVVIAACGGEGGNDVEVAASGFDASASSAPVAGVVTTGRGRVTVPASQARVVAVLGDYSTFEGGFTDREREEAESVLRDAGYGDDIVEFHPSPDQYAPPVISVEVPVDALPSAAEEVEQAIIEGLDDVGTTGLWFTVDDCTAAFGSARDDAVADARAQAEALAAVASVELGEITSLQEAADDVVFDDISEPDPCRPFEPSGLGSDEATPAPIDASADVELEYSVTAVFDLGEATRSIAATGTAIVEQAADQAYIVVSSEEYVGSASGIDAADRSELEAELAGFGVAATDIVIEPPSAYTYVTSVRVEVPVDRLDDVGADVVDEITGVVGEGSSGVVFATSACDDALGRARNEAFTDATERLDALGASAGVTAGAVVGLVEGPAAALYGTSPIDPCDVDDVVSAATSFDVITAPSLQPLDADPVARVAVELNVTRAIDSSSGSSSSDSS